MPWIGIIAELHRSKGIEYAVHAMGLLRQPARAVLCVVGEGKERQNLEALIRREKLGDRVFLLGHIDDARTYLAAFDALLVPSITEALGYAPLEAGVAGLPVIASRVGGIPEIIEDQKTGILVDPREPAQIAEALEKVFLNSEKNRCLAANLHQKIIEKFSLDHMLQKTFALYHTQII